MNVTVWYYDNYHGTWRFDGECTLEEFLGTNGQETLHTINEWAQTLLNGMSLVIGGRAATLFQIIPNITKENFDALTSRQ